MPILEKAKPAEFAGIKLLVDRVDVTWAHRIHLHEYPHRASAALEKLGRRPYEFKVSANFDEGAKSYPNLYPVSLNALRQIFEEERSADLVLPTFGTIRAFLSMNVQQWSAASLSGEHCDLSFIEDASEVFTLEAQIGTSAKAIEEKLDDLFFLTKKIYPPLGEWGDLGDLTGIEEPMPGLFDSLDDAVREFAAIGDQVELGGQLLEAKALKIAGYCAQIEKTVGIFGRPAGAAAHDVLKEIWSDALRVAKDIQGKSNPIATFTVPVPMSIQDVSRRVFGTTERSFDLMQLNAVDDPLLIPAATVLRYYAEA